MMPELVPLRGQKPTGLEAATHIIRDQAKIGREQAVRSRFMDGQPEHIRDKIYDKGQKVAEGFKKPLGTGDRAETSAARRVEKRLASERHRRRIRSSRKVSSEKGK
jgi:hypothetical protein